MVTRKIRDRFQKFFWITKPEECWNWTGCKDGKGYATFSIMGKSVIASRIAYLLEHGEFDKQLSVLHSCDNPLCVNPRHLFLGTQKDNMQDVLNKNRQQNQLGERNTNCKLLDEEVNEIRDLYSENQFSLDQLASQYGVTRSNIGYIVRNKSRRVK